MCIKDNKGPKKGVLTVECRYLNTTVLYTDWTPQNLHVFPHLDQFNQMCPSGRGFIPDRDLQHRVPTAENYKGKNMLHLCVLPSCISHTAESMVWKTYNSEIVLKQSVKAKS